MKKIKFILPFAALATVPAIVMPLTSCNQLNKYTFLWKAGDDFPWYTNKYLEGDTVCVRDVFPKYISEFDNVNKAIALDIVNNIHAVKYMLADRIEIKNCFFDTYELRLSNDILVQMPYANPYTISVSNLKYCVLPEGENNQPWFVPAGYDGSILQDKSWYIKYHDSEKERTLDCNTSFAEWKSWWLNNGQWLLKFCPKFYSDTKLV